MEHLHHSFAGRTRQGGFLKSNLTAATERQMRAPYVLRRLPGAIVSSFWALSDQPHKRRPADLRKRGASFRGQSFRRQRNKLLSRVKLRLRYRLSFLAVNQESQSKSRYATIATSACMQQGSVWILRIQSSHLRYRPFSPPSS
jgi:hypothetical protein